MLKGLIQQAFDWFDPPAPNLSPVTAAPPNPRTPTAFTVPPKKVDTLDNAVSMETKGAQGDRRIVLGHQPIAYQLERSKRRSIGFIVGNHGLAVRAPKWTPIYEIERAIQEKSHWILRKLHEVHERQVHQTKAATQWIDGGSVDHMGTPLTLRLGAMNTSIDPTEQCIWIALPSTATQKQVQDAVQSAMQRAALLLFETRLNHYAPILNVQWTALKLSNAGGRWGSASSDGTIRLNWRLMHFRLPVIDYVVVHELSHLRHMNHSPRFWETVEAILPEYKRLKKELKPV